MRMFATIFLLAMVVFFDRAPAATLRGQLAQAEKDEEVYSQIELIRRILDQEPGDAELQEQLVVLWTEVSDYDMAEAALKAWKDAPKAVVAAVTAEVLFQRDKKPAEAIALLEEFRKGDPDDIRITTQLAGFFREVGEPQKLVALLASAPGADEDADLIMMRAEARRTTADYPGALEDFGLAAKVDEETANRFRPAYERLQAALPKIAEASKTLSRSPGDLTALVTRAYWHAVISEDKAAAADAAAAHKASPGSAAAAILLARSFPSARAYGELAVDKGKPLPSPQSLATLLQCDVALARNPRDAAALTARCFELNDSPQQYRLALADAAAILALQPANPEARVERIYALIRLNRVPEAAAEVLVLAKNNPPGDKLARAYGYLAEAALKDYQLDNALEYATRGLKAKPGAGLYKTRAAILQRLGRTSEANADLAEAKKL